MEEHLDLKALTELKEVMEEDFEVLLSTYLSDSAVRIRALRVALESNSPEEYAKTAHSLKGSCINIGAMKLGRYCSIAENDGRTGYLSQASSNLAAIETEFAVVSYQLSAYLRAD